MKRVKLAYLVSEPIIYQAPLLRRVACEPGINLKVFFARDQSAGFYDAGFGKPLRWDIPLLDGYEHEVLPAVYRCGAVSFARPFAYGLASRLKRGGFDVLWVHGYMRLSHWLAIAVGKKLGLKILVRDEATEISRRRGPLRKVAKKWLFGWLKHNVDCFLAIGSLNREYYIKNGIPADRIFAVPYAVDNGFFQREVRLYAQQRKELRCSLSLENGRPIILYAGKLIPRKRPQDLLEAYLGLSPDGRTEPHCYLLYVGDGELRSELERRVTKAGWSSIKFLGFKNQTELPAFYDLCDVFVMPTVHEPWGLVVNEAMNAGRAVLISDEVGCARDLVANGVNGLIFRARDVTALRHSLADLLADPNRLTQMGAKSLEKINQWGFEEDVKGLRAALEAV